MAKFLTLACVLIFIIYQVKSQMIKSPLSLLNRPFTETIIDSPRNYIDAPLCYADAPRNYIDAPKIYADASRNYIDVPRIYADAPRNYIDAPKIYADSPRNYYDIPIADTSRNFVNIPRVVETPRNYIQPQPNIVTEPPCSGYLPVTNLPSIPVPASTTIITDCTPSVCKNLINTINLMIACNLMQDTIGDEQSVLQFTEPVLKELLANSNLVGFSNPISNLLSSNVIAPNGYSPSYLPQNLLAPNFPAPSLYSPTSITSRLVAPNCLSSNTPADGSGLFTNLIRLMGSA